MTRRIYLALQQAISAAHVLTAPKADVAASDRAVKIALRDSRLFRVADAAEASGRRAWPRARTRTWSIQLAAGWVALSRTERIRATAAVAFVGGITAAVVQIAGTQPAMTLIWVVPAAVAALGLLAFVAAVPLARAMADKTS